METVQTTGWNAMTGGQLLISKDKHTDKSGGHGTPPPRPGSHRKPEQMRLWQTTHTHCMACRFHRKWQDNFWSLGNPSFDSPQRMRIFSEENFSCSSSVPFLLFSWDRRATYFVNKDISVTDVLSHHSTKYLSLTNLVKWASQVLLQVDFHFKDWNSLCAHHSLWNLLSSKVSSCTFSLRPSWTNPDKNNTTIR